MNIQDFGEKLKGLLKNDEVYTLLIVVLVGAASFGLGRASVEPVTGEAAATKTASLETTTPSPPKVTKEAISGTEEDTDTEAPALGKYVASKSGSKYHLPWCGGAKQIKDENKIWFETKEEAERAGYAPASNCKGI